MGGALGVLGVGYAGRSQRRMRRVNRSAARLSRGGIGDLRVECVKEVSGRVSFSIWGAGAPWERPPTDYLKRSYVYVTGVGHTSLSSASIRSGEIIIPSKMWHQRGTLTYPRFRTRCTERTRHGRSRFTGTPQRWAFDDLSPLHMQALRQGRVSRPVSKGMHAGHKSEMGAGQVSGYVS